MADISKELDKIAELIAEKTNKAVEEVTNSLIQLVENKTSEEALEILSGINMQYVMNAKMSGALVSFEAGVLLSLKNTYSSVVIPEASLRILVENAKKRLLSDLTDRLTDDMMSSIVNGIATGQTASSVMTEIGRATPNVTTLVNTAYSQFSNNMTNMLLEKLPDDTMMVYIGANDDITRDDCKEKINFSPATKKEILRKFGNFNNELWNCRHKWEEMSSKPEAQGFEPKEFVE